jgi:hypothetical protein
MGNDQTNIVEKPKTHIICSITFFRKSFLFLDSVKKYCRAGQDTQNNKTWSIRVACSIPEATDTHTQYVILLLHYKFGCTNTLHCVVVRALSVFFRFFCSVHSFQFIVCHRSMLLSHTLGSVIIVTLREGLLLFDEYFRCRWHTYVHTLTVIRTGNLYNLCLNTRALNLANFLLHTVKCPLKFDEYCLKFSSAATILTHNTCWATLTLSSSKWRILALRNFVKKRGGGGGRDCSTHWDTLTSRHCLMLTSFGRFRLINTPAYYRWTWQTVNHSLCYKWRTQ